jgi:hypothetical protein
MNPSAISNQQQQQQIPNPIDRKAPQIQASKKKQILTRSIKQRKLHNKKTKEKRREKKPPPLTVQRISYLPFTRPQTNPSIKKTSTATP